MSEIPEVPPGLSENLVEVEGDLFRVVKDGRKKRLVPVRVKVGLNPLNVAAAGIAALGGVLAATIAWHGVSVPTPIGTSITLFQGIKDTGLGKSLKNAFPLVFSSPAEVEAELQHRENQRLAGEAAQIREDTTCEEIAAKIQRAERRGDLAVATFWRQERIRKGCP